MHIAGTDFDSRQSPLSSFIYASLGPAAVEQALDFAREVFAGQLSPDTFLRRLDPPTLAVIARAAAEMAPTRREALLRYASL